MSRPEARPAHFLTFGFRPLLFRPFPHSNTPYVSLKTPITSPESAHFLTYPAQFFTFRAVTRCSTAQIRPLNLNLESLNQEKDQVTCQIEHSQPKSEPTWGPKAPRVAQRNMEWPLLRPQNMTPLTLRSRIRAHFAAPGKWNPLRGYACDDGHGVDEEQDDQQQRCGETV